MDKWIARIVTFVLAVIALIFAVFGKAGGFTYARTKSTFNVQAIALEKAEENVRAMEREKAHAKETREFRKQQTIKEQVEKERKEREAEVDHISRVVYAESWIEGEYGWRLVTDVLLNRIDSERFPNDIWSVVSQPGQFETYSNGAIWRAPVKQEIVDVVYEEMARRTNTTVLFFTAGYYNPYCVPMFKYKHHYFGR